MRIKRGLSEHKVFLRDRKKIPDGALVEELFDQLEDLAKQSLFVGISTQDSESQWINEAELLDIVISAEDYERVVVWPTVLLLLCTVDDISEEILVKWGGVISKLFSAWFYLTLLDKRIDGEIPDEFNDELVKLSGLTYNRLDGSMKRSIDEVEKGYLLALNTTYNSLKNYIKLLRSRYRKYGEYVAESIHLIHPFSGGDREKLSTGLSDLLTLQQLFDDTLDWQEDFKDGNSNWYERNLVTVSEKLPIGERVITKKHKQEYIFELLPKLLRETKVLTKGIEELSFHNGVIGEYFRLLLEPYKETEKSLEECIS